GLAYAYVVRSFQAHTRELRDERPVEQPVEGRFRQPTGPFRDNQDVGVVGVVDRIVAELPGQGLEHGQRKVVVELVELHPLDQQPVFGEIVARRAVELLREQARDTADPGVGRFRDDDVIRLLLLREEGFRVLDMDRAAGIFERPRDALAEAACRYGDRGFDLDGIDAFDGWASEQRVGREPGPEPDVRDPPRIGL